MAFALYSNQPNRDILISRSAMMNRAFPCFYTAWLTLYSLVTFTINTSRDAPVLFESHLHIPVEYRLSIFPKDFKTL